MSIINIVNVTTQEMSNASSKESSLGEECLDMKLKGGPDLSQVECGVGFMADRSGQASQLSVIPDMPQW